MQLETIQTPLTHPPAPLSFMEVAPGVLWLRLPLPYSLDHVNIYLIEDHGGWTLVDTGLGDETTLDLWKRLLAGPLAEFRITRIIVTHCHPDHIGCAGWLCRRLCVRLATSFTEYLFAQHVALNPGFERDEYAAYYLSHGLNPESTELVLTRGHDYLRKITGLPTTFMRLAAGELISIGGRTFHVLTGGGHAPDQVMLVCPDDKLFLAADQVMLRISPNVSVVAVDPDGDPLGIYLRSLAELKELVPSDALVLPGHYLPFIGLRTRAKELEEHHAERCELILRACEQEDRSAAELVPFVFHRPLDPHQMGFAFSEVLAHTNYMIRTGELEAVEAEERTVRFRAR